MAHTPFEPDSADMLASAIKYNGNIAQLAKHYNVSRETIYQYLKRDAQGKLIVDTVRGVNIETNLDMAEYVISYNMSRYKENAGLAQRAAEKVIDRLGYMRGWKNDNVAPDSDEYKQSLREKFEEMLAQIQGLSSQRKIDDNKISNETKS